MAEPGSNVWMRCSACRKDIPFGSIHWVCSVSTCNRARTALVFCSVACWDSHLSTLRHREAWAVEERAPTRGEWAAGQAASAAAAAPAARSEAPTAPLHRPAPSAGAPVRTAPVSPPPSSSSPAGSTSPVPTTLALSAAYERDVLIVVSKMKKYIKDRSGMNTSEGVTDLLSEHVRLICDDAIRAAHADERKTVL